MNKLLVPLAVILVCILITGGSIPAQAMAAISAPAIAAQPEQTSSSIVRGTFEPTKSVQDSPPKMENGTWVGEVITYQDFHGTLEGKVVTKTTVEIGLADRQFTSDVEGTFTGTINGKQGSFTFMAGEYGQMFTEYSGALTCKFIIINSDGELSGLNGNINTRLSFDLASIAGEYWGTLNFEK